eukprot:c5405_g1_i1 orf=56-241(+)
MVWCNASKLDLSLQHFVMASRTHGDGDSSTSRNDGIHVHTHMYKGPLFTSPWHILDVCVHT